MTEPFGFDVSVQPEVVHEPDEDVVRDVWYVDLPHQCDSWTVAHGTKAEVAAELSRFIAEASEALDRLAGVGACPHEWEDTGKASTNNSGTQHLFTCRVCGRGVWKVLDRSSARPWYAEQYYASPVR